MSDPVGVEAVPEDLVPRAEIPRRWPVISKRMARRLTDDGRLPVWVIGHRMLVSAADVEAWLVSCRRPAVVVGEPAGGQVHDP
ncbi:helix-turn-helix domain-containing protein [Frankia tisae]|uniref:helix-turn-helix domain-containing protein n=1 Tax=Frankia tisae TaxID=2950104 RepID=UPI0021C03226|nr:helix-turn-helix domain-containing protein [Frankia tisae]